MPENRDRTNFPAYMLTEGKPIWAELSFFIFNLVKMSCVHNENII